ncbi:MAG: hypothetical protein JWM46_763 [Candidatus Kaiserbacteria bacterium]|nr:hypothetical protein [Candidatus Kaiserbacteria bacterium]
MSGGNEGGAIAQYFSWLFGLIFDLKAQVKYAGDWGISRALYLGLLFAALYLLLVHMVPQLPFFTISWLLATAPIWMPIGLFIGFWKAWIWYIQSLFLSGRNPVLLEVRLPREIYKSPRAMEVAISLLSISSGETTFIHRAWKGQVRPFFSFEIASFGGELHFYIWCWRNYKAEMESAIYGQYPEVELHEVEDYASKFQFDTKIHSVYATEWRLESYAGVKPDDFHINAYPIKSYVDFELDKDPKEEYKVDPLATILELLSNILPEEQIWVQIVIRKCGNGGGPLFFTREMDHEWIHAIDHEVEKIRTKAAVLNPDITNEVFHELHIDPKDTKQPQPRATWGQTETMRTLERHKGKYPFEFGGRAIYATTGHLHGPTVTAMRWLWKPIGNPNFIAHLRPRRWHNPFDFPWQDVNNYRFNLHARRAIDAFRRRLFFHSPWHMPTNVLTNESIATMWHPPSSIAAAPGLSRIPATKSAPPLNLPK